MEDGRPSLTAIAMAALRAHHYLSAQEPRILGDSLAMRLIGMASPAEVRAFVARMIDMLAKYGKRSAAEATVQRMTMTTCVRSRFMEDQLDASLRRGMKQLVILGAGLDSTAYRRPAIAEHVKVFEVDHPATQAWKREKLASISIAVPANVGFVPYDFERQTMDAALAAGGVRRDVPSFFSWLGVQPYLTDSAVTATLEMIATFAPGSELVLDLMIPEGHDAMDEAGRKIVASFGEPFKTAYAPEVFAALLHDRGFTRIEMITFPDWLRRHDAQFRGRFSTEPGRTVLVTAQVA